jgi:hypothetical protein
MVGTLTSYAVEQELVEPVANTRNMSPSIDS